jgi:hypothetical protein
MKNINTEIVIDLVKNKIKKYLYNKDINNFIS